MKKTYPIVLIPEKTGYSVYVPDFDCNTQGDNLAEALDMAKDVIEMTGVYYQDEKRKIPVPSNIEDISTKAGEIKTLVNVDFDAYRRANENKTIKKTLTMPSWLNEEALKAGINFSAVLQNALKQELGHSNK